MANYNYIAKNRQGEPKKGVLEAEDEHQLAAMLREEGYVLIKADLVEKKKFSLQFSIPFLIKVSLVNKIMFTRNLRVMVTAGVSLPRALSILSDQTKSKKFKKIILDVRQEIIKGEAFSNALSKHSSVFPEVFINMIKVGEESGTLEKVLDVLTNQMEKEYEIRSRLKGAMIYPIVIICAMLGIGTLMLILVVPKLSKLFDELKIPLPLTTRVVVALGNFLNSFWYLIPFVVVLIIFLFRFILQTKTGKLVLDTVVLKTPLISPLIKKTNAANTVRTLSSLVSAGVPIVRSLEIVSGALGNIYYKRAIMEAADQVRKGKKLGEVLKKYENIYPILVIQMIAVGEETGETSTILQKLADFFEDEVANATKNMSSVIEPILMLIIGAAVGFFAISMIQPMYSMLGAIE
jgi:type IV pilus assembly protein PilC